MKQPPSSEAPTEARPRVAFRTVGCRLNQAESAALAGQFEAAGYSVVPFGAPCDVCVINTCTITAQADKDGVRLARQAGRATPRPLIALIGCAAEVDAPTLRSHTGADLVVGQDAKADLVARIESVRVSRVVCRVSGISLPPSAPPCSDPRPPAPLATPRFSTTRAILKIQDGCAFGCAYCIVPRARPTLWSRPLAEIAEEARRLVDAGFREFVLSGANLGCYREGDHTLLDVIAAVEAVSGVARIRLSSIESSTVERGVIDHMARSAKLCHSLHLPLQSGDDRILAAMGRRYRAADFRAFVEHAVARIPRLGLGTDVLVGFPGEDEAAFRNTVDLVASLPFSRLHVFPYSARPGTRAAGMSGQVSPAQKKRRVAELLALGRQKSEAFAQRFVGQEVSVLVETVGADGTATGWTSEYVEAVVRRAGLRPNELVTVAPGTQRAGKLIA